MPQEINGLAWDFDNTIRLTETPWFENWAASVWRHCGQTLHPQVWDLVAGSEYGWDPRPLLRRLFGITVPDDEHAAIIRKTEDNIRNMGTRAGVIELLRQAKAKGLRVAVATNADIAWIEAWLPSEVRVLLDVIVTIDDVGKGNGKPKPDIYREVSYRLGVDPGRLLAIEDTYTGVTAAHKAGAQIVFAPTQLTRHQYPSVPHVRIDNGLDSVSSLSQVQTALRQLSSKAPGSLDVQSPTHSFEGGSGITRMLSPLSLR